MIIDQTMNLQVSSTTTASTSEPEVHVVYVEWTPDPQRQSAPAIQRSILSGPADVDVLSAPVNGVAREIQFFSCFNKYAATRTIAVKTDDGTTDRTLMAVSLSGGRALVFVKCVGWEIQ